jgi:lipoate-protein ligase A
MRRLLLTLPTPAENLALDEAMLDWAEGEDPAGEYLRVWESPQPIVVVGRSSRVHQEVDLDACARRGVPILRRASGGAAVVAGPGCLLYAVVLSIQLRPDLRDIRRAHSFALGRLADALRRRLPHIAPAGTSDLVLLDAANTAAARKFSGNSLRAKRTHLLYHGTLLYDFDLPLVAECLRMPPRMPTYRGARSHADFLTNLPVLRHEIAQAVLEAWPTDGDVVSWPQARVVRLVSERFACDAWNLSFGGESIA